MLLYLFLYLTATTKTWTKSIENYRFTCPRWSWHRTRRSSLPPSHWKFWWQVLPSLLCEVQLSVIILKENILIKGLYHCHYRWKSAHRPITLPPSTKVPPVIALMVRSSFSWWTTTSANKLSTTTTTWSQRHHQQSSPQNNTRLRVAATSKNIINNKNNLTNNDLMINNNSNLGQGSELQLPSSAGRSKSGHLDFGITNIFDDEDHCCQKSCWKYIFDLLTLPGGTPPSWSWPPPRRWLNRVPNSRCSMSLTLPGRAILTPHHIIRLSTWRRHPTWAVSYIIPIIPIIPIFQNT